MSQPHTPQHREEFVDNLLFTYLTARKTQNKYIKINDVLYIVRPFPAKQDLNVGTKVIIKTKEQQCKVLEIDCMLYPGKKKSETQFGLKPVRKIIGFKHLFVVLDDIFYKLEKVKKINANRS